MDSSGWKLDFDMQILLAHALKSEAGIIKQYYPEAKTLVRENGQELIRLNQHLHLLRTGMGLALAKTAMSTHVDPGQYDLIIHFGVSGSLSVDIPVMQIVEGTKFSCHNNSDIAMTPSEMFGDLELPKIGFYSSYHAITDEAMRNSTKATGAQAVDMESYSIAQFCQKRDLALLAIRCISDRAGVSTPEDFRQNYSHAAQTLQNYLLEKILTRLPASI